MFEATGAGTMVIFFRGAVPTLCSCLRATNGKRGIETYRSVPKVSGNSRAFADKVADKN